MMKIPHLLSFAVIMSFSACAMPVRVNDVLPQSSAIAAIKVVRPNTPVSTVAGRKTVDSIMAFLRDRHWTMTDGREAGKAAVFRLILQRADGTEDYVDVMKTELVADGYDSFLPAGSLARLASLCGPKLTTVRN